MAIAVLMVVMMASAAFATSKSKCNAGKGNGQELVVVGEHSKFECDPGNSGNTPAADND